MIIVIKQKEINTTITSFTVTTQTSMRNVKIKIREKYNFFEDNSCYLDIYKLSLYVIRPKIW